MSELLVHLLLFAIITVVIVVMGAFFAEPDDARALRSLPRRLATFVLGCAILTALMLVCEHTFARLG